MVYVIVMFISVKCKWTREFWTANGCALWRSRDSVLSRLLVLSLERWHCCFCWRSSWMPHLSDSLVWETRHARGTPPSFLNPEIESKFEIILFSFSQSFNHYMPFSPHFVLLVSRFCKRCLSGLSIVTSQLFPYQVSGKMAASYTCPRIFQALSSSTSKLTWKWCQRILRRRWEMKPITPQVSGMVPW
jgi:hypothetical protein